MTGGPPPGAGLTASLTRPAWYDAVLGKENFLEAMINARYREQYEDASNTWSCAPAQGAIRGEALPPRHEGGFECAAVKMLAGTESSENIFSITRPAQQPPPLSFTLAGLRR